MIFNDFLPLLKGWKSLKIIPPFRFQWLSEGARMIFGKNEF